MPSFKIRTTQTTFYEYDVEAENLQDAIDEVEGGEIDGTEYDSASDVVTEYAIEGQMGWNDVDPLESETFSLLAISTSHVTQSQMVDLCSDLHPAVMSREYGVLFPLRIEYDLETEVGQALLPLINFLRDETNADYIMLDRDADVIEGLQTYVW